VPEANSNFILGNVAGFPKSPKQKLERFGIFQKASWIVCLPFFYQTGLPDFLRELSQCV
jgi:hypothetical protein